MTHASARDELARLLAAGCPDATAAAFLARWADFAEELRVLWDRRAGNRGNGDMLVRFRGIAGRQRMPEEMARPRACPLGRVEDEPS